MDAIILAGGFGTRLRTVVPDLPKPMAPIQGKPFLAYLLDYLQTQGICSVVLSVHHLSGHIRDYFQSSYAGMQIDYADEVSPLGTGGAILHAFSQLQPKRPVFVLNGDTFIKLNYQAMYQQHEQSKTSLTIALGSSADCSRYGKVITDQQQIQAFKEKGEQGPGFINAGVYLINEDLFSRFTLTKAFSFEKDFLLPYLPLLRPQAFFVNDYFIDIGVPEDYARANSELPLMLK